MCIIPLQLQQPRCPIDQSAFAGTNKFYGAHSIMFSWNYMKLINPSLFSENTISSLRLADVDLYVTLELQ